MHDYQRDELFRGVYDVLSVLEHVNINDLAFHLVRESPEIADKLSTALGFELMDRDFNEGK